MKNNVITAVLVSILLLFSCQNGDGKEKAAEQTVRPKEAVISSTVKTEQKEELTMQSVYEFIKECKTYYLATVEADGQPRVRPFGTIDIFNGKLYIQTGKKKNVSKQLAANPKAELCCFDGKKWLRLSGELVNDDSVEAKKHMLDNYPSLRGMYDENDDNTQVLYFKNATAVFTSFGGGEPKTVKF
jgi:uncharacterized pyridoxamine 5'-phosphate oxidase family protein